MPSTPCISRLPITPTSKLCWRHFSNSSLPFSLLVLLCLLCQLLKHKDRLKFLLLKHDGEIFRLDNPITSSLHTIFCHVTLLNYRVRDLTLDPNGESRRLSINILNSFINWNDWEPKGSETFLLKCPTDTLTSLFRKSEQSYDLS